MNEHQMRDFITRIPKAENHIHLDTVPPAVLLECASRNRVTLPFSTVEEAEAWYKFDNLQHFLGKWKATQEALRTEDDYALVVEHLGRDMKRQNIIWREAMFCFHQGQEARIGLEAELAGISRGRKLAKERHGVDIVFIANLDRTQSPEASLALVEALIPVAEECGIVGLGLESQEIGFPAGPHARAFDLAREAGLKLSAHCGEEFAAGPDGVWDVIRSLKPDRIDHGVQAIRDPSLVSYLKETQIPLMVAPISNVCLNIYSSLREHPIIALCDLGVKVTLNSDDPPFLKSDLIDNYMALVQNFGLSPGEIADLVRAGFSTSYAPDATKADHIALLDKWLEQNPPMLA